MAKFAALAAASPLVLAACGGASGHAASAPTTAMAADRPVVSTQKVAGVGTVAVDASGRALYTPEQEAAGHIRCTGACVVVWPPLTVPGGVQPMGTGGADKLGVVARPDGSRQVTYNGKPLYRFSFDTKAGQVSGNGASDSFGAAHFTWHVVNLGPTTSPSKVPPAGGGGYGGYSG